MRTSLLERAIMTALIADVQPAAKHPKSGFGLHPLYDKQTDAIVHIHPLQQKTPHRYLQSPVFSRKSTTSCPTGSVEHSGRRRSHHHHHHQRQHSAGRRRRGISEGNGMHISPEEKVHLLSELPWRKSGDFSSLSESNEALETQVPVPSVPRLNVPAMSPTLPRRYEHAPNFERERTWSMPMRQRPLFTRREKQRARSQDSSPTSRKHLLELPIVGFQYSGSLVLGVQNIAEAHSSVLDPDQPETPLADSDGNLKLPSLDIRNSPESLRRFLGFNTDINHNNEGLTEEEIKQSRLMCRRQSSSSDSSTSTLT